MNKSTMLINAESILKIFELVGDVMKSKSTDEFLMKCRVEDLEKKLENAEMEIEALKGGADDKVRK